MATKRKPGRYWWNLENRVKEVRGMVERTGKDPQAITLRDFKDNGLDGLVNCIYFSSVAVTLKEAGYDVATAGKNNKRQLKSGATQRERRSYKAPQFEPKLAGFWQNSLENRVNAVKNLAAAINSVPTYNDYHKSGLGGLLNFYKGSSFAAAKEAGLVSEPWEMKHVPNRYFNQESNRIRAVKWLVAKAGKDRMEITDYDFACNGLGRLLSRHYHNSARAAMKEAGFAEPWELNKKLPEEFWKNEKNRVRATKWLLAAEKIYSRQSLTKYAFMGNGLEGLLDFYRGIPHAALKEAGLAADFEPWEMLYGADGVPESYWAEKENRIRGVKWLVDHERPDRIRWLCYRDFEKNQMCELIDKFYNGSVYDAVKEAGYSIERWEIGYGAPRSYWKESKENRVRALNWLVQRTRTKLVDMHSSDFDLNNLSTLLEQYDSVYDALKEAGLVDFEPWQMKFIPAGLWQKKENRIRATRWAVEKTGKKPLEMTTEDFVDNRLQGLLRFYRGTSRIYAALTEAGYNVKEKARPANPAELLKLYIKK